MSVYEIFELSARAVMSYAVQSGDVYSFHLNRSATEHCRRQGAKHEQDDCAMFHQLMCQLKGRRWRSSEDRRITDLSDVIFYMDFSGIFDRSGTTGAQKMRRDKARDMFRPEGVVLDFGSGLQHYVSFERSASMSRRSSLSFIRADLYEPMRQRIMLDMELGRCQLSKLYAYNGLMFSGGARIDDIDIAKNHRVIVVDNPEKIIKRTPIITLRQLGQGRFERHETLDDVKVTCFDGVGLISKEYAARLDKAFCGNHIHHSFQIRMPYIKGMLHEVDFKDFFKRTGTQSLVDIWGKVHSVREVDIILTKSQLKAAGWMEENDMSWKDYWTAFKKYDHALYITNVSKVEPEALVDLNYQFLSTVSIRPEEFRPAGLPDGWTQSPASDTRQWLTKATEQEYYNFCADEYFRRSYFLRDFTPRGRDRASIMARVLRKNPKFIYEPVYKKQLDDHAQSIVKGYAVGRLLVPGDNRFLSGDLLELLRYLTAPSVFPMPGMRDFCDSVERDIFAEDSFFAPGAAYAAADSCTLLRNPHIARNEELQMSVYPGGDELRQLYFGHLTDVVMVSADTLAAERLGGADYDGDLIKTIADPILNACVKRNYDYDTFGKFGNDTNLPLLKIPSLLGAKSDSNDWQARFRTVENTFAARIGQICNAAMDRSVIAYDEKADPELRKKYRRELEMLAILSGLEIDASKTGVRPDLDEFIGRNRIKRSAFLQYKYLAENADETRRAWYEPTHEEKLNVFFARIDWSKVDSPVERLPYLARQLERNTPKAGDRKVSDGELFAFAQERDWKKRLDSQKLSSVAMLLKDYETCLSRIRACKVPVKHCQRKSDIDRILYARGQEDIYDPEELYAFFQQIPADRVQALRRAIVDRQWHFMAEAQREEFLWERLPEAIDYFDLLSDFQHGGFRILGDLVCDTDDMTAAQERKQFSRPADSPAFRTMMQAYEAMPFGDGKYEVSRVCQELLLRTVSNKQAVRYVVAAGKRKHLWDLLPDQIEADVLEAGNA